MIRQSVLPFKIEMTRDTITPHAGLALFGEFAVGLGLRQQTGIYRSLVVVRDIGHLNTYFLLY